MPLLDITGDDPLNQGGSGGGAGQGAPNLLWYDERRGSPVYEYGP
jgi:hypothetical protein